MSFQNKALANFEKRVLDATEKARDKGERAKVVIQNARASHVPEDQISLQAQEMSKEIIHDFATAIHKLMSRIRSDEVMKVAKIDFIDNAKIRARKLENSEALLPAEINRIQQSSIIAALFITDTFALVSTFPHIFQNFDQFEDFFDLAQVVNPRTALGLAREYLERQETTDTPLPQSLVIKMNNFLISEGETLNQFTKNGSAGSDFLDHKAQALRA